MLPCYPVKFAPNNGVGRRLAMLGLAAAGFLPNALPAAEIDPNVADAGLRGQSRFLALAAEQALAEWQPGTALLLTLNALPGIYGGDRPLVAEAQVALNRAFHDSTRTKQVEVSEDPLFAVISPAGIYVAAVPKDADMIEVFDVATGARVLEATHDGIAEHAAFAPGDQLLATLGEDGLRLWDLAEKREVAHFDGRVDDDSAAPSLENGLENANGQPLSSLFESLSAQAVDLPQLSSAGSRDPQRPLVAFSPDGETVAFASEGGRLEVRRLSDQKRLHQVEINPKFLYFDQDGGRIMVMDREDDQFKAMAIDSGDIEPQTDVVIAARTLGGTDDIKLGGVEDGHLILFNAAGERTTEIRTKSLRPGKGDDADAAGSLRESTLIAAGPGVVAGGTSAGVLVWDPEKTRQLEHFRGDIISSLSVSHNGEYLLAGTSTGEVRLWDTDAFGSLRTEAKNWNFAKHTDRVVFVGFTGDGETTVSLSADRTMTIRKLPARKTELQDWGLERSPTAVLSPDGRWVSRYNERTRTLNVWDVHTGERQSSRKQSAQPLSRTSFHPQRTQILASSPVASLLGEEQPAAEVIDFGRDVAIPATDGRPNRVDRSIYVDGGRLVVTAATEKKPSISIWDAETGRLLQQIEGEMLLAGSWLGSHLLTRSDRSLMLYDLEAESSITLHTLPLTVDAEDLAAEFDDRGTQVLIRSGKTLSLWDTSTLALTDSQKGSAMPTHFGLSADGSRWFSVTDGALIVRQDGLNVDILEVDEKNLLFALVEDRIVTVTLGGSLLQIAVPNKISPQAAIAALPAGRLCLTPEERDAYDLPSLSNAQWRERGCRQFASN